MVEIFKHETFHVFSFKELRLLEHQALRQIAKDDRDSNIMSLLHELTGIKLYCSYQVSYIIHYLLEMNL